MTDPAGLNHFDAAGHAHMVDVSDKAVTSRIATARGRVEMSAATLGMVDSGQARKGDVLAVARLAGIMAAKKTSDLIPLCHPLPITNVSLDLTLDKTSNAVLIEATVKTTGQTGVEMEALTAVTVACLTVYDMLKAVEKSMRITDVTLILKDGGKSGRYEAQP